MTEGHSATGPGREAEALRAEVAFLRQAAREIDHRAANSLQVVGAFLRVQGRAAASAEARAALAAAADRVGAMARSHRFFHSDGALGDVDLAAMLEALAGELSLGTGAACRARLGPMRVPPSVAAQLALAVNELVLNACKHAFAEGAPGRVTISGGRRDGRVSIDVADDGRGWPDGFDPAGGRGLGMTVVLGIAEHLGGTMRLWTDGGAHATLSVPVGPGEGEG